MQVFFDMRSEQEGAPDGMKVDEQGNVYSGGPGPALWIINPVVKCLGRIMTPDEKNVVNMAFGDTDKKSLYLGCVHTVYRVKSIL